MTVTEIILKLLTFVGGISLFLFGMNIMSEALEKSAGSKLKSILGNITSNKFKGLLLGLGVTAVIQSSSATTVMLVGFVNSGLLSITGAIPVIMGANIGTTVTAWLLSLTGIEGDSFFIKMLKPSSFTPILALIGVILYVFMKGSKKKDIGLVLLGFATLIFGMDTMSSSIAFLEDVPEFRALFTAFENPLLGLLVGAVVTGIIQSSSASVGILQALASTGIVTYGSAIPIIMGQNIGTCVTAMISSVGANKNAKRVAAFHLTFNVLGSLILMAVFYLLHAIIGFGFVSAGINEMGIAIVHTAFNLLCTAMFLPFTNQLAKLSALLVRNGNEKEENSLFDARLLDLPSVAIGRAHDVTAEMAEISLRAVKGAIALLDKYDEATVKEIFNLESEADVLEDEIGSYLLKITTEDLSAKDSVEVTKLLHMIGDLERLSDHAVNIAESATEMKDKGVHFSSEAKAELSLMCRAVLEIASLATEGFVKSDTPSAATVEPLEEVIDRLKDEIRLRHIARLKKGECTAELGFILSDILTDLERISDHCSNIAGCAIEIEHNALDIHTYARNVKEGSEDYLNKVEEFSKKYSLTI